MFRVWGLGFIGFRVGLGFRVPALQGYLAASSASAYSLVSMVQSPMARSGFRV